MRPAIRSVGPRWRQHQRQPQPMSPPASATTATAPSVAGAEARPPTADRLGMGAEILRRQPERRHIRQRPQNLDGALVGVHPQSPEHTDASPTTAATSTSTIA